MDERVGGAVVGELHVGVFFAGFEFGEDFACKLLAEFDAPLVVAVDVPEDALHEDFVLVHGKERAEGEGIELVHEDGVGGAVAFEDFVGCEEVDFGVGLAGGFEFGFGAEVGISTDKLHVRGPMALEGLTSYKYEIYGNGQVRT